ncbi:carboxypeptidase-like regulatory domain-containing protein, partial [candidate division KSB1 bacterium]|nr:carboxypeptidase-like regulatory domain-containing protein [candidate division KSB1 bacterium]
MAKNYLFVVGLILSVYSFCYAQTTGKIAGKVIESGTGEPLPGANVIIEGTGRGAATGSDGFFYIINVPPGAWTIRVEMMGYETKKYNDFRVSVNRTSNLTAELKATVLEGQVVVVQADKISIKKDQTSSIRNVSSEEIDLLPVEDTGAVIEMQTGVVGGHFRGGRIGEVSYMIDGMQVDNALNRSKAVDLDKDAVQDMEVITGTFDAEYGNAMSGVVNLVTKDGQDQFHGKAEGHLANYITSHDNFIGLEAT